MEQLIGVKHDWKGVNNVDEAKQLIDYGILLKWKEMRPLKKAFSPEQHEEMVRHMAIRIAERADTRLSVEVVVETLLIWLTQVPNEGLLFAFFEELFQQDDCEKGCWVLVESSLTIELTENAHDEEMFAMAVVLCCELGLALRSLDADYPGEFQGVDLVLDHIATYLLSISNVNNNCTRLSLLHYFGVTMIEAKSKESFQRIMSRFGHTALDQLFSQLFYKKTESVALQYLIENLPFVLQSETASQRIIHETFKYYMLKQPDRFALFLQTLADEVNKYEPELRSVVSQALIQHVAALIKVASEVNHKSLGRELLITLLKVDHPKIRNSIIDVLYNDGQIRKSFKELISILRAAKTDADAITSVSKFRASRRGRRPSFNLNRSVGRMEQVTFLGAQVAKAS